jgi:hypothetical protein
MPMSTGRVRLGGANKSLVLSRILEILFSLARRPGNPRRFIDSALSCCALPAMKPGVCT